jgi:hypothetical protein
MTTPNLDLCVVVIVHPVDVSAHPTYPPGYRWAVMVGGRQPADLDRCVGAGHAPSQLEAATIGESHGSSACLALRMFGINAEYALKGLDFDPIPSEADHRPLRRFG